ncbi:hypothetical protein BDW22DRAFT_708070 [Trametopsis cervina]|nr:hypothetical protein BDW22DRAFT_708070 [Trametopsis cervina]
MSTGTPKPTPPPEKSEYSIPTWKRVPSTWDVLFSLQLPYRSPTNPVAAYLWRKRLWFETTFALTMMARWEKAVLLTFLTLFSVLLFTGIFCYFPVHLSIVLSRAKYYLSGNELPSPTGSSYSAAPVQGGNVFGALGDYAYAGVTGGLDRLAKLWNATGSVHTDL